VSGIGFLVDFFFPFNVLNVSTYCLLASKVSDEKSADDTFFVVICFFLAAFKRLSLSLSFESLVIMHHGVGLFQFILLRLC